MSVDHMVKRGIGGWLILPASALVLAPIGYLLFIFGSAIFLYTTEYNDLSNKVPGLGGLTVFQLLASLGLLAFTCTVSYSFFKKTYAAPKLMEKLAVAEFSFEAVRSIWGTIVVGGDTGVWILTFVQLFFLAMGVSTWILYFEMSRRVQATFVN